jgi:hypothetical protein
MDCFPRKEAERVRILFHESSERVKNIFENV